MSKTLRNNHEKLRIQFTEKMISEMIRIIPNLFWKEMLLSWAKVVKSTWDFYGTTQTFR